MKTILEFFNNLGIAEFIITILLFAMILIAYFDSKSIDKRYERDQERFDKNYKR